MSDIVTGDRAARVGTRTKHHLAWRVCECPVCGQLTPLRPTGRTVDHYALQSDHAYCGNPTYFCSGSNGEPAVVHDALWGDLVGEAPITNRRAVLTITFRDEVSGEDVRRLARAWANKISEKQAAASVHVKTHGTTT